jgi:LacI family transcriptional regulator
MIKKIGKSTLADVSKAANVSLNTAAKVLAGQAEKARISEKTAQKIKKIAQQIGYVPNIMARNLRAAKTGLVGVFVAEMTDPVYAAITHSILEQLPRHGFFPLLTVAEAGIELCRQAWLRNRIEGLILCGTTSEMTPAFFSELKHQKIDAIIAGNFYETSELSARILGVSTVHLDNHAGIQMGVRHLREQGCRKIAFLTGPGWHSDAKGRRLAYENVIKEYHKPIIADPNTNDQYWQRGYLAADLLAKQKLPFDAVIAYDDLVAVGAIKWFTDHNINVPADIKVMGFDNLPQSEYSVPPLTSLEQPCATIGQKSVELLKNRLQHQTSIEHIYLIPSLIIRDSTNNKYIANADDVQRNKNCSKGDVK